MEVLKVTVEKEEEKGDELELSLELSIGGRYRKSANLNPREENVKGQISNCDVSKPDRSCGGEGMVGAENGCESVDPGRRREIQALRRQEARKKRDEKLKKSRGVNCVGFVEDNVCLEAQKFQSRVEDREAREIDDLSDLARKRDKNVNDEDANGLSLSLFTENKMPSQQAYPKVQSVASAHGSEHSSWGPNVRKGDKNEGNNCGSSQAYWNRNSSLDYDSEHSNGTTGHGNRKTLSNGSLQWSSSAVSDYQSTSQKVSLLESSGGSSCDGGSHSSPSHPCQNSHISRTTALDQLEGSGPNQSERSMKVGASSAKQSSWSKPTEKAKPSGTCFVTHASNTLMSTSAASPSSQETAEKPPKPPNHSLSAASVREMPCVTATGNGPNAKTINGFLYKYSNTEVSIMCVCHRRLFSPAEFVEHAGGVDITHPLRHITVAPSAFRFS